jgi:hypothetical protein
MVARRNIQKLMLLVALTVIALSFHILLGDTATPAVDPALFRVPDTKLIDRVELVHHGVPVSLKFTDGHWKVNDIYDADRQRITLLFATLGQAIPKRPIAAIRKDSVAQQLKENGVTVRLYQADQLKKEFLASGNSAKTESYFSSGVGGKAYVMMIPGYRVYVSQIFDLDENEWRDKRVFAFPGVNFKSMQVSYPADPKSDFEITEADRNFSLTGMPGADTTRLFNFLDDVSFLVADRIQSLNSVAYDSLSRSKPVMTITVHDIANRTYFLSLFQPRTGNTMVPGLTNGPSMVLFDPKRVFRIAKKRSYFTPRRTH